MEMENSPATGGTPPQAVAKKSLFQQIKDFALLIFFAAIIVIPVRVFVAKPFIVSGSSMFPTFENSDYLIVDELSYHLGEPERFDVVIFKYPKDPSKFYIKRIIGLPNEEVVVRGNNVTIINEVYPEGLKLEQPFVENDGDNNLRVELGADEYFVMGDNRSASSDSRYWGPVKKDLLIGRAFIRLLPVGEMGILPGSFEQENN